MLVYYVLLIGAPKINNRWSYEQKLAKRLLTYNHVID